MYIPGNKLVSVHFEIDAKAENYGLEFRDQMNIDSRVCIYGDEVFDHYLRIRYFYR